METPTGLNVASEDRYVRVETVPLDSLRCYQSINPKMYMGVAKGSAFLLACGIVCALWALLIYSLFDGTRPLITPNGKYVLLDDDIATGGGIQYVREYVEKQGGIVAGVETIFTHEGTFDVLDASDVTTIQDTGLVISSSLNNPTRRVPYLHPHIPLDKFASVPRKHAIEFTESVINILKKYKVGIYS